MSATVKVMIVQTVHGEHGDIQVKTRVEDLDITTTVITRSGVSNSRYRHTIGILHDYSELQSLYRALGDVLAELDELV